MNANIKGQLLRGLIAAILGIIAIMLFYRNIYIPALLALAGSLFFFRGCPTCWLFTTCGHLYCDSRMKAKRQKDGAPENPETSAKEHEPECLKP